MTRSQGLQLAFVSTYLAAGLFEPALVRLGRSSDSLLLTQAVIGSAILFWWCKTDAKARGVKPVAPLLVAMVPPLGLPYYLFRTRATGKAWGALGKAVLFYLGTAILYNACFMVGSRLT